MSWLSQIPARRSLRCIGIPVDFGVPLKGDCPPAVLISKYLAGGFHALERFCRSRRIVLDGLCYLVYRHDLTGKRQFLCDKLAYWSPASTLHLNFAFGSAVSDWFFNPGTCLGLPDRNSAAEDLHCRLKTFLTRHDQLGFLRLLYA